ncbi:ABC transporter ATP-binding protein [Pseudovibrio sp. Tun.PSC04-5.I4]|uniref:ATP-binding cassette domain-containing protein n=1 Tax=Pseudovibrio sp. Tun.PSC04-5.I4 TaxID=1798213 RepID=UPI000884D3CB|nr:ABC transporter ATP-binding protein [Pseudovibrio sp. Tun.PSC04-5.I4]SDR46980.1 ATP-binding cassette, subfamily B [Pseudovibrio sp. Tun.PSC04-5.I4]
MNKLRNILKISKKLWQKSELKLKLRFASTIIVICFASILTSLTPVFFKEIIDTLQDFESDPAWFLVTIYIMIIATARLLGEARWAIYGRVEQSLQATLYIILFKHLVNLTMRFHTDHRTGSIQQVASNGLMGYRTFLFNVIFVVIPLALELIVVFGVILTLYDFTYLSIIFSMVAVYITIVVIGAERLNQTQRAASNSFIEVNGRAYDYLSNVAVIKCFNAEKIASEKISISLKLAVESWSSWYRKRSLTASLSAMTILAGISIIIFISIQDFTSDKLSIGDFVLINTVIFQLLRPLEGLSLSYRDICRALIYIEGVSDLFSEKIEANKNRSEARSEITRGEVVFRNVRFGYEGGKDVVQGLNFQISAGKILGIVGPSGSGKSTIARLLLRLYETVDGRIDIDGKPADAISHENIRDAIAIVSQETTLFNDTIGFNIGMGRLSYSQEDIEEAAKAAELHDFVLSLPNGYDTIVGQQGLKLSGGERQRVAIARALIRKPKLFIFDEATSSLDSITEQQIQKNILKISRNITTLIIAHRLSTVCHADELLVMDKGSIIERGTHNALILQSGVYAKLWRYQDKAKLIVS